MCLLLTWVGLDYQGLIEGGFPDIPVLNCPFVTYTSGSPL